MKDVFAATWLPLSKANLERNRDTGAIVVMSPSGRGIVGAIHKIEDTGVKLRNGGTTTYLGFGQRGLRFCAVPLPEGMRFGEDDQPVLPL